MKFMILIYGSDDAWKKLDRQAADRIGDAHRSLQADLEASGELVDHSELAMKGATIVRSQGGEVVAVKGPFTEGAPRLLAASMSSIAATWSEPSRSPAGSSKRNSHPSKFAASAV